MNYNNFDFDNKLSILSILMYYNILFSINFVEIRLRITLNISHKIYMRDINNINHKYTDIHSFFIELFNYQTAEGNGNCI